MTQVKTNGKGLFYAVIDGNLVSANWGMKRPVRLKSGSPEMFILKDNGDSVLCRWFSDSGLMEKEFPKVCVEEF